MKYFLFILPLNLFAQLDTARVFFATESMIPVTQSQIFVTAEPLPILLEPNGKRMEYTITVKEVVPVVMTNKYDNVGLTYTGSWVQSENNTCCNWFNNSLTYSNVIGNSFTFSFTGNYIEYGAEFKTGHGRATVSLDGVNEIINLGSANTGLGVVWSKAVTQGSHTLTVTVLDAKYVVVDYILTKSQ